MVRPFIALVGARFHYLAAIETVYRLSETKWKVFMVDPCVLHLSPKDAIYRPI